MWSRAKTKMETLDIIKLLFPLHEFAYFETAFLGGIKKKLFIWREVIRPMYACKSSLLQTVKTGWVTYRIIRGSLGFVCLIFVYKFQHLFAKHLVQINGLETELQRRDKPYPSLCIFALNGMKCEFNFSDAVWEDVKHKTDFRTLLLLLSFLPHFFPFFFFIFISRTCNDLLSIFHQCSSLASYLLLPFPHSFPDV